VFISVVVFLWLYGKDINLSVLIKSWRDIPGTIIEPSAGLTQILKTYNRITLFNNRGSPYL
jgi:hypothetical protein